MTVISRRALARRTLLLLVTTSGAPALAAEPDPARVLTPGMGLATDDYNADGHLDFFFTNAGPMTLLQNQRDGSFLDVAPNTAEMKAFRNAIIAVKESNRAANAKLFTIGPADPEFANGCAKAGLLVVGNSLQRSEFKAPAKSAR